MQSVRSCTIVSEWRCISLFLWNVIWKSILQFSLNNSLIRYLRGFLLHLLKVNLYCLCRSVEVIVLQRNCCRRRQWYFTLGIKWEKEIRQWADVSCQRDCSNVWCYHFLVACYHLCMGGYHPQRSAGTVDSVHCTFTEAYENNHASCLCVCRHNSENINSV